MAFLINKTSLSQLRLNSQDSFKLSNTRRFSAQSGDREKNLLADDPSLKRFKTPKKGVQLLKRISDVVTVVVVAGLCYEVYVHNKSREQADKSA